MSPVSLIVLVACIPLSKDTGRPPRDTGVLDTGIVDTGVSDTGTEPDCPDGVICVDHFPYTETNDTSASTRRDFDAYDCAPSTDESGTEIVYRVTLDKAGYFSAVVDELEDGVDVDAHLLRSLDANDCIERGNHEAMGILDAGTYWVVVDTYVSDGDEQSGPYALTLGHTVPSVGNCDLETGSIDRVGDGGDALELPARGPVVLEAHLVTDADGFGGSWPSSEEDGLSAHYATSQSTTGFVMWRDQPWAPQEGCEYGQGSYGSKLPVEDEGWYVNMYWSHRPDGGTRMILLGDDGRAVVVAAGYETGPGDLDDIAGATEEVHHYLGTGHESVLTLGFAADPDLPLGPITCE